MCWATCMQGMDKCRSGAGFASVSCGGPLGVLKMLMIALLREDQCGLQSDSLAALDERVAQTGKSYIYYIYRLWQTLAANVGFGNLDELGKLRACLYLSGSGLVDRPTRHGWFCRRRPSWPPHGGTAERWQQVRTPMPSAGPWPWVVPRRAWAFAASQAGWSVPARTASDASHGGSV